MSDFKKLHAVETVETVSDKANVLIEENGIIKKVPKNNMGLYCNCEKETGTYLVRVHCDRDGNVTHDGYYDKALSTILNGGEVNFLITYNNDYETIYIGTIHSIELGERIRLSGEDTAFSWYPDNAMDTRT